MIPSEEMSNSGPEQSTIQHVIGSVAHVMEHVLSTGELAQLRRASPANPYTPALWRVLLTNVPRAWTAGVNQADKERRWATILAGMAVATGLHSAHIPLGRALSTSGYSELRFVRLLQARGAQLDQETRLLARYLANKSEPADWADIARLLLHQQGQDADIVRRRIARAYYQSQYRIDRADSEE